MHLVKLACELPDTQGRSLSRWTCAELARTLRASGVVDAISPQTVQRLLESHQLQPWRVHYWLSPKAPRDETFRARVLELCEHCSWMNQVEQWFSILQRKRMVAPNFAHLSELETKILAFIAEWNAIAHPFAWTRQSFDKILAKVDAALAMAA